MGGVGSGRGWQDLADTTEGYRSIDVRWLKREGLLSSGISRCITWSRGGKVSGSINVKSEPDRVILDYRHRARGGEWQAERYPVQLDTTACNMGGQRHWFLCQARGGCGRRVAILYGGAIFACRHCYQLVYPSQREKPEGRAVRCANRIRDKMDWPGSILEGGDLGKPKGMHWRTYQRLCDEHDILAGRALADLMDHLIPFSGISRL